MATNYLVFFLVLTFSYMIMADDTCPYPCYPPPTGAGNTPVATNPPPSPPSQSVTYPPPAGLFPPPSGNLPNYPSPPFDNNFGNTPPPPDPILPYFPFYYRKPPHGDQSSSIGILRSRVTLAINCILAFTSIYLFS